MLPEENGRPRPVQGQLGAVRDQGQFGRLAGEASAIAPHQVGAVAHSGVQGDPHRRKDRVGRLEGRELKVGVPALEMLPGQPPVIDAAQIGQNHGPGDAENVSSTRTISHFQSSHCK